MNLDGSNGNTLRFRGSRMTMNEEQLQNNWSVLKKAFEEIQEKNWFDLSFEKIYQKVYVMVLDKRGEIVYNGLTEVITDHLVKKVRVKILGLSQNNFLETLHKAWNDHISSMVVVSSVLMYIDRVYVPQHSVINVYDLGLILFRDHVVRYECIRDILRDTLLDMIKRDRKGEVVHSLAIKNACDMLIALGIDSRCVYEECFEQAFLAQSAEFYKIEGQKFLEEKNVLAYVNNVNQCIHKEAERTKHYLDQSTGKLIVEVMEEELISQNMKAIVEMENGIVYMLNNQKTDDLACICKLFRRVDNGLKTLTACVSSYLQEQGKTLVTDIKGVKNYAFNFVKNLLDFKDGFELLLNINPKSPEYLSLFIDDKLKKEKNEIENEKLLDKTTVLLQYLQEKDVFELHYIQHLAKRLLFNKSVSYDSEKNMVNKLKNDFGFRFTFKLEGMLKDLHASDLMMEEFKTHVSSTKSSLCDIDLNVRVLTNVIWPKLSVICKCNIPMAPRNAFEVFRRFYLAKHSGRQLKVQPQLGFAELRAVFFASKSEDSNLQQPQPTYSYKNRKYTIQVSTYQMCILMLFNNRQMLTFEEIASETDIPLKDLVRALQSLTRGKSDQILLTKIPNTKEFEPTHQFTVNDSFTSRSHRIKIHSIASKSDSEPKRKETRSKVEINRKHEIEAAIVRIMKARRQMNQETLVAEVTEQLKSRFLPNISVIKALVEGLIQREYLNREEDKNIYSYLP